MHIANAPCSWGILEFESTAVAPGSAQVLDEIAATGYAGTELGDWGFLSTDPAQLRADLTARELNIVGAFVPVALSDPTRHAEGEALAVKTARLLAAVSTTVVPSFGEITSNAETAEPAEKERLRISQRALRALRSNAGRSTVPTIVLSDAPAIVPWRTAKAGRIEPEDGLTEADWTRVAAGAGVIARAVRDETGLRTAFHPHCATYVETPAEIAALMERTPPDLLGLCLDTGHATYGGGDPAALLDRYASRVWHVHFKDCSAKVAARARAEGWDYITAVRHGLFCELGQGTVDFAGIAAQLRGLGYDGWIVVEQDVLPALGTPADSAARNRRFLRQLGL